jgi:peptidoglycan hydrolase-like protein with peptidoglycan-binding domain
MMAAMGRIGILALGLMALLCGAMASHAQFSREGIFDYRWDVAPPIELITTIDIQKALIWSGHYNGMADGAFGKQSRTAAIAWQESHGYQGTGTLSQEQIVQVFNEGVRTRDAAKWTLLVDRNVGVVIPYPAALTNFKSVQPTESGLQYSFEGSVNITVMLGRPVTCANLDALYKKETESQDGERQILYKARRDNWYVVSGAYGPRRFYTRAECRSSGTAIFIINVPGGDEKLVTVLFSAFSNGVSVAPALRLDAKPDLATQSPELASAMLESAQRPGGGKAVNVQRPLIDPSGKTSSARLALASGSELRPQDVFERARGAVYVVKPDDSTQGSAVAIGANELLTNCHVVGEARTVSIMRDGQTLNAEVVSRNKEADRCVLRSAAALPSWVMIRPYADLKVGERVYSIGAPQGLELTLAEGLVSSKRTIVLSRFIQTSAPISPGSSGGGLFDAWGNLIGITTFLLKDSQNLNFAIVAEDYIQ